MPLRLMLDVNVLVSRLLALREGVSGTASSLLFDACVEGQSRLGPLAPVASLDMIGTLRRVALRLRIPDEAVEAMVDAIEGSFVGGPGLGPLHAVVGGGVMPMRDAEDRGVMEAAVAGGVELLVTDNLKDFTSPNRADLDCEAVADGVFLYRNPRLPEDMVIARKDQAFRWLLRGAAPPDGLFARHFPAADRERNLAAETPAR